MITLSFGANESSHFKLKKCLSSGRALPACLVTLSPIYVFITLLFEIFRRLLIEVVAIGRLLPTDQSSVSVSLFLRNKDPCPHPSCFFPGLCDLAQCSHIQHTFAHSKMQIVVKLLSGKKANIDIESTDTIKRIKERVEEKVSSLITLISL